jgi:hypothetical protein
MSLFKISSASLILFGVLALVGCYSTPVDEFATAISAGERPVAMEGSGSFFEGSILAKVTISRGVGKGNGKDVQKAQHMRSTSDLDDDQRKAYYRSRAAIGSPLAPLTIHVYITNTGSAQASVDIVDFISDLGNFALQPEILEIPAGQTLQPETVVSQLGITSDSMPFKITLKVGGKKQTQTVIVASIVVPKSK